MKRQKEIEEDEAALKAMEEKRGDESKQAVQIKAREEAMKRKIAEVALIKSRKRGDPNNPCKEEVDAQQVFYHSYIYFQTQLAMLLFGLYKCQVPDVLNFFLMR